MNNEKETNLILGNSLDLELFSSQFIDLTVTSPPYNLDMPYNSNQDNLDYSDYLDFSKRWLSNVYNWTRPTGRLCLNIPITSNKGGQSSIGADLTGVAKSAGWKYHITIIWHGQHINGRTAWGSWMSASAPMIIAPVELIVVLYKNEWKKNYKGISDITREEFIEWTNGLWNFPGESAKRIGHPAPFPPQLPYRCIKMFSYQNDTVFDPFLGSGTTGVVAKELGRNFTGVELDQSYYDLSCERIKEKKKK